MKSFLTFALALFFNLSVASSQEAIPFENTNIRSVVEYFRQDVFELKKSVTVYHWAATAHYGQAGAQGKAQEWSQKFWNAYGKGGNGDMYGSGLYAAVDPVLTFTYGGGGDRWMVIEMQMPAGFRLLDLTKRNLMTTKPSQEVIKILQSFDCKDLTYADQFFSSGGASLQPKCQTLVKKIFQDVLQIDGFAYSYSKTDFKDCARNYGGHKAIVMTNPKWMNSENVRYYLPSTKDKYEGRVRIQTLFLKAYSDQLQGANNSAYVDVIENFLNEYPTYDLKGSTSKCDGDTCVITVQFCDPKGSCKKVDLPSILRPGGPLISEKEAAKGHFHNKLLWPDLEGKPKAPTVSQWLKENIFACDGAEPYK